MNWPPLRLPTARLNEAKTQAPLADVNPVVGLSAQAKLLASAGHYPLAGKLLQALVSEYPVEDGHPEMFRRLWPTAILTHASELALSLLKARFTTSYHVDIEVAGQGQPVDVALMHVHEDHLRLLLSPDLFEFHAGEMILDRLGCVFPLWDAFMRSPRRIDGTAALNLLDHGTWPGLAFCDHRPEYFLIPDPVFMGHEQYKQYRADFRANEVAWRDRAPVAFWRGSTTGIVTDRMSGWRGLPRIRLCEIAAANPDLIDAGITAVSQIEDKEAASDLQARNLMRPFVDMMSYRNYRYQIDIDGNSNAWEGLFVRLLTGSPVLKVASPNGFRQWYYDRLEPWVNFVPVATDMSDLVEKLIWLHSNDDAAHKIGEAGRALAESLDIREIDQILPVIATAMRAEAGKPLTDLSFGTGDRAERLDWDKANPAGVSVAGFQRSFTLPRPRDFGDYVLMADVSCATRQPRRMTISARGMAILSHSISARTTIYAALPHAVATAADEVEVTFAFPGDTVTEPDGSAPPAVLHRLGVATVDPTDWAGYPNIGAFLSELNSNQATWVAHDLGWHQPEPADLIVPPGTVPQTVYTWHGSILFADRDSGRVRHGPATEVPRNLFAIRLGPVVLLAYARDHGGYVAVRFRPEGRDATQDNWIPWAGGFARTFTVVTNGGESSDRFGLRAAGLFLCAEFDGGCTLSRPRLAEWETFHFG